MRIIYKWKVLTAAFTCFLGISLFFIFSSVPQHFIGNYLHVDPSYIGGLVCADFIDATGDGIGAAAKSFDEEALDLVRYTVCEPVTNARWQQSPEYWQLSLEYKSGPASVRNIMIYIDLDNVEGGNTEPLFDSAEKICFDDEHPWDFVLWICGGEGKLFDSIGNFICNTEYYALNNDTKIIVRIPLRDKKIQKILGAEKTWHYVLTCEYEMPDSWNSETFENAKLCPLEASMIAHKISKSEKTENARFINYVKELYYESSGSQQNQIRSTDENLIYYKEKITDDSEDFVSLAYYGSWLAVKGGESSVIKAVALVNEAYTYLDKAAEMADGNEGEIDVLMNRASVSASVPEQVFGKAQVGAADFMKIVSLTENETLKAYCYVMAYECYLKCGKETQAILALQEAKKMLQLN